MGKKFLFKRTLSIFLVVVLLMCSVPMTTISAFAESKTDYSNLTASQYLAKIFTNNNYSGSLNNYGMDNDYVPYVFIKDFFIDVENRSKARIIFNEFKDANDYKTTHGIYELLTFSPSGAVDEVMELEDYYTAILLSLLDAEMADKNFIDDLNCKTNKTITKLSKNISSFLETTSAADYKDLGSISIGDLTENELSGIYSIMLNDLDTNQLWDLVGKNIGKVSGMMSGLSTVNDAIKSISNLAQLANVSVEMQEVLHQIYLNCPDNNKPMKNAARKVYEYVSGQMSYEVLALSEATQTSAQYAISALAGQMWSTCLTAVLGELSAGVLIGQAVGKLIANYCFATDAVDEQLCAISALVDFENVLVESVHKLEAAYKADDNTANSDSYIASLYLLMDTYELGCDYVEDFIETAYTKGIINNILYGDSGELREWDAIFANQKNINSQIKSFLYLDKYKAFYKADAPSAYESYFGIAEVSKLVPMTGMEIQQKVDINVGDKGSVYDFFSISYLPINHTEIELVDDITSSNESIIRTYSDCFYGNCIEAVGDGTCTLTFISGSGRITSNIEVIVDSEEKDVIARGTCGENVTWRLDRDGVLTISGTGEMEDYKSSDDTPWYDYIDDINSAVIENGVTSIGGCAFSNFQNLTSVTIPDSVTSIGWGAFEDCYSLKDVYYTGSEEKWNKISIGYDNYCLTGANIHYNYVPAKPEIVNAAASVKGDVMEIKAEIKNLPPGAKAIAMAYGEGGEMSQTAEIKDGSANLKADGVKKVKVFVWESLESMKPLCEAKTVEAQ